jgi:SAM-dependent methyltransferase
MQLLRACWVMPMDRELEQVRASWEKRAAESGASLSGVLFRNLSEGANRALDQWHATILCDVLLPRVAPNARVLDLGCGYGRLSSVVASARPDVELTGQDLSLGYCRVYRESTAPCVVADVARTPFTEASFDAIFSVTCLMYVPREHAREAWRRIAALLRPGGVALLLDPARELQEAIARVRPKGSASPTGGAGFRRSEYEALAHDAGFRVIERGGNPALSLGLLIPGVARSGSARIASLLASLAARNCRGGYSRLALHRWLLVQRDSGTPT